MKKRISKILLVMVLSVPFMVKADMGAPMIREYEAVITTDRKITCKDGKKTMTLSKGDKVKVSGSVIDDDEASYYITSLDYHYECDIKVGEFAPVDAEVKPTDSNVYDQKEYTTFEVAVDNLTVRKGPDVAYEEVGKLQKGTIAKFRYINDSDGMPAYVYVDYNGIKGWINITGKNILVTLDNNVKRSYIASKDTQTKCGVIPRNTVVAAVKAYGLNYGHILLYNGCEFEASGIYTLEYMDGSEIYGKLTKDTKIYEYADTSSKVLGTAKKGEYLSAIADSYGSDYTLDFIYVHQNGVKGWVKYYEGLIDDNAIDETTTTTTQAVETTTTKKAKEKEEKKSGKDIVVICVIVAAGLAVAALSTILIINKKKNKKVEKKEEVKVEEQPVQEETTSEETTEEEKKEDTE